MKRIQRFGILVSFAAQLCFAGCLFADEAPIAVEASFIGGAGAIATNSEFALISSWRQPIETSISTGGDYDHASGFLAAISDFPVVFRILSFGFALNPTPCFRLTIPTRPGQLFAIQFADSMASSLAWQPFLNTNQAVGTYLETNSAPANFTFTDDFTVATSGGPSLSVVRFYRVIALESPLTQ